MTLLLLSFFSSLFAQRSAFKNRRLKWKTGYLISGVELWNSIMILASFQYFQVLIFLTQFHDAALDVIGLGLLAVEFPMEKQ